MNRKQVLAAVAIAFAGTAAFAQEADSDAWQQAQAGKSFAQVRAELHQARKDGSIKATSAGYIEKAQSVKTREQVRAEVLAARASGELEALDAEAYAFAPAKSSNTALAQAR